MFFNSSIKNLYNQSFLLVILNPNPLFIMNRNLVYYLFIFFLFTALSWVIIEKGESVLRTPQHHSTEKYIIDEGIVTPSIPKESHDSSILEYIGDKLQLPISILILQIIIIIIASKILGWLFTKIGQPTVVGEIIAGILLGPSLLGFIYPDAFNFIFPDQSLNNLEILSQIGLILFMFIIGMELDVKILKVRFKSALIISHSSILAAFFFGVCLSYMLFEEYAPPTTSFGNFALFIGIALSIAAFPVLARIIQERGMTKSPFGKLIITVAAIDDLTAWCILAIVIAIIQAGSIFGAIFTIILVLLFIAVMLFAVQPLFQRIGTIYISREILSKRVVAFVFFMLFLSAYFTEIIGIKALFGGFMAGVIMPSNAQFKKLMAEKIEDFSLVVLLPLFFVFTGLRTQIGLISGSEVWMTCALIILFAITGKFGGSLIASKFAGLSWKDSVIVSTLMNTRGLMQLIVLNIGYDIGVISPQVFAMMVVMTLVTTFMTGPVLSLTDYFHRRKLQRSSKENRSPRLNFMISFGLPKMGTSLLRIAHSLSNNEKSECRVCAMHFTPQTEISQSDAIKYELNSFAAVRKLAHDLNLPLTTLYKTTEDVAKDIIRATCNEKPEMLLLGAARSIFNKDVIGGKVKHIIDQVSCNVGIFVDKDFKDISDKVLVIADNAFQERFISVSRFLIANTDCQIHFISNDSSANFLNHISTADKKRLFFYDQLNTDPAYLKGFDLLITHVDYFEEKLKEDTDLMENSPSLLLVKFRDS